MSAVDPYPTVLLRHSGLRVTASRHAVLAWLFDHPHATAEQVHRGVADRIGSISKQAVYDVLAVCVGSRLVRRIEPAGHPARFERRTGDNHHHLVCRACGRIDDADCRVGEAPCLAPEHDHGFDLDQAEVVFWGFCPECRCQAMGSDSGNDAPRDPQQVTIDASRET